jgi:hypothetical protein
MRRLALGLVLIAPFGAAACGSEEEATKRSEDPVAAVAAATEKTTAAGTSRVSLVSEGEIQGQSLRAEGTGALDYGARRGTWTVAFSGEAAGALAAQDVDVVVDGFVMYMRSPLLSRAVGTGKQWLKFDLNELSERQGINLTELSRLSQGDPSEALNWLRAAGDDVEEVGTEEVRGAETTHYRATIDLRRVDDLVPSRQREATRRSIESMIELTGQTEIPTEVWIDADGRVRRYRYTQRFPAAGTGAIVEPTITTEFFDFGVEVDAEPPPRGEVTDVVELIERAER